MNKPTPNWHFRHPFRTASIGLAAWLAALLAGYFISTRLPGLSWLLLPPLELLAIGLPLWWWVEFGGRGLRPASALRKWSVFGVAVNVSPLAAASLQILVFGGMFAGGAAWFAAHPELSTQAMRILQRISNANMNPEVLLRILRPLLLSPAVILTSAAVLAGVIPLVEEMVKPLALWGFARQNFSPAEGWTAGLICGAAFGLLESLTALASTGGDSWTGLIIGRLGTGLLHTVTAGLTGWALAEAWSLRRYVQLGLVYLLAVLLHGLWNAFAAASVLPQLLEGSAGGGLEGIALRASLVAPFALGLLIFVLLLILTRFNQVLRRQTEAKPIV